MNGYQKTIFVIGLVLLTAMFIYPPWEYTFQDQGISQVLKPAGYHLVFDPPSPEKDSYYFGVTLDIGRLMVQALAILVLFGSFFYLLRDDE